MITGSEDPISGGPAGLSDTKRSLRRIGYMHVQSKVFEGMRHEVLMELDKHKVFTLILTFLESSDKGRGS